MNFDREGQHTNPHAVTTALKLYLRERTNPLIPYHTYKTYCEIIRRTHEPSEQSRIAAAIIESVGDHNRLPLVYLVSYALLYQPLPLSVPCFLLLVFQWGYLCETTEHRIPISGSLLG